MSKIKNSLPEDIDLTDPDEPDWPPEPDELPDPYERDVD